MSRASKIAGVLGGMGPDATVDFMSKVIGLTDSERDQDHVRMLVDHNPQVPDRQAAILRGGEDPGSALAEMAARLEAAGADFLVIPCNTAYVFESAILEATRIPLISIIAESVAAVDRLAPGAKRVGVLATDGCVRAGVFQAGLEASGLTPILPDEDELEAAMKLIGAIKGRRHDERTAAEMAELAAALVARGAEAVIAGCTEIPLVLDERALDVPLIASTDVLAEKTVMLARGIEPLPKR